MKNNRVAVIAAGGSGSRMGASLPKQYIKIGGEPIIIHTLRQFTACDFDRILALVPIDYVKYTTELLKEYEISGVTVISGGKTRNDTILKAISFLREQGELDASTILLTHDSVRPFVTRRIIEENLEVCTSSGTCTTAIPATDTIVMGGEEVEEIFDRSKMQLVQTPQTFKALRFEEIYSSLTDEQKELATDCTRLFTLAGEKVYTVSGDMANIKLTYQSDIAFAEGYVKWLRKKAELEK
ncbi:MAG: 2-C-methyl-D-erythritol 4-phosphate cytidylyltransferase [Ruminococcus sp.]|nr:2-C-methyl-D-erythritol 4-phosphate cytidylyltransferase [Ruminococcus sp.]